MKERCGNCHVTQEHPSYLWRVVLYKDDGEKVVCPSCWEWARAHPDKAEVTTAHRIA